MRVCAPVELAPSPRRGRIAAVLGVASALLLAAAVRWAHHWGPLADTIVGAWVGATLAAFVASSFALLCRGGARRLAGLGMALALLSVCAPFVAYGAGTNTAGSCGGG